MFVLEEGMVLRAPRFHFRNDDRGLQLFAQSIPARVEQERLGLMLLGNFQAEREQEKEQSMM
jgi:hypothetical protein